MHVAPFSKLSDMTTVGKIIFHVGASRSFPFPPPLHYYYALLITTTIPGHSQSIHHPVPILYLQ